MFGTVAVAQTPQPRPARQPANKPVATTGAPVVSETVALQVMLDRAGFSPGEIDGKPGANLRRAIGAFQRAHGLDPSARLDDATWQRLSESAANAPPLLTYELTNEDVAGPFEARIPDDLMAQAGLKTLAYSQPLERVAEKFHASPGLLQQLNGNAAFAQAGERIVVPNVEPFDLAQMQVQDKQGQDKADAGRRGGARDSARGRGARGQTAAGEPESRTPVTIAVTKSTSSLTVEDASGRVLFHAPVTSGSEHDPLPIGNWKVTGVQRLPVFNYNPQLFWDADPSHSKARIAAGPNNPVGVAWIDLSKEHYGIHGTAEPSRIGHVQSHGCVRLTNWDVARVLQWARTGTPVVFRE